MRPAAIAHGRKIPPDRLVLEERMALELVCEQRLEEAHARVLVGAIEARALPGFLRGLDDEGRMTVVEAIGMDAPEPVRIRLEIEREGVEAPRGAEPDELVRAPVELRPEGLGMGLA